MHIRIICILYFLLAASVAVSADDGKVSVFTGDGFIVGVENPVGWEREKANISGSSAIKMMFYPPGQTSRTAKTIIQIAMGPKSSESPEDTKADFDLDLKRYRKDYPSMQISKFSVKHPTYRTYSTMFFDPDHPRGWYQYMSYVNAGSNVGFLLVVRMIKLESKASQEELAAFSGVVKTINAFDCRGQSDCKEYLKEKMKKYISPD